MNLFAIFFHLIYYRLLSLKKSLNLFYNFINIFQNKIILKNTPIILTIEPTNVCNFKCPLCLTGQGNLIRKKTYISFDYCKKIIDEIGDKLIILSLYQMGEPFLNKEIYDIISYAKTYKIFVRISTNGSMLNNDKVIEKLIKSKLDHLIISIDGASSESYDKYRKNGDFYQLINNIKRIVELKKKLKSSLPIIDLQFIIMKHNEHEIDKIKRLKKELNVDYLSFKSVCVEDNDTANISEFLPEKDIFLRYSVTNKDRTIKTKYPICFQLLFSSVINSEGLVIPCCRDHQSEWIMGDIKKEPFIFI